MKYNDSVAMIVRMIVGTSWMVGGVAFSYWYASGSDDPYDFLGPLRAFAALVPMLVGVFVGWIALLYDNLLYRFVCALMPANLWRVAKRTRLTFLLFGLISLMIGAALSSAILVFNWKYISHNNDLRKYYFESCIVLTPTVVGLIMCLFSVAIGKRTRP